MVGVGTNRYAYAGNDPVNKSDASGHIFGGLGKAVGDFFGGVGKAIGEAFGGIGKAFSGAFGGGTAGTNAFGLPSMKATYAQSAVPFPRLGPPLPELAIPGSPANKKMVDQTLGYLDIMEQRISVISKLLGLNPVLARTAIEDQPTQRFRHYTNLGSLTAIMVSGKINAVDQGKVFAVPAGGKNLSPREFEAKYGLKSGKGNSFVEFSAKPGEFTATMNSRTGVTEYAHLGDISLVDRNPVPYGNY